MYSLIFVDDEDYIRGIFPDILDWESLGYIVVSTFSNAEDALSYMQNNSVDVVVTDIQMPGMSGVEFAEKLSLNFPETMVVFLSAHSDFEYARKAIKYNVVDYIVKPMTYAALCETFSNITQKLSKKQKNNTFSSDAIILKRQNFFLSYIINDVKDNRAIINELSNLNIDVDIESSPIALVNVGFLDFKQVLSKWSHGTTRLYIAINNIFSCDDSSVYAIPLTNMLGSMLLIIISRHPETFDFQNYVNQFLNKISENAFEMLKLNMQINSVGFFDNLLSIQFNSVEKLMKSQNNMLGFYDALIERAKSYIMDNLSLNLTQEDVAKHIGVNVSSFRKIFKELTGIKYVDYLVKCRIEAAKQLLDNSKYKVGEISQMVGYKSEDHFFKVFKMHVGVTPQEYRRTHNTASTGEE